MICLNRYIPVAIFLPNNSHKAIFLEKKIKKFETKAIQARLI